MSSHGIVHSKDDKSSEKLEESGKVTTVAAPESSEAECSSSLTEVTTTSDGTSIDVHQLPVSDIYTVSVLTDMFSPFSEGRILIL